MSTHREELAWAAGFFDGEGHVGASTTRRKDLYLSISQVDRRVLDRFQAAVGCGTVNGPYLHPVIKSRGNEQPRFYFQTQKFEHVQAIVAALWHWLSPVKREQAVGALLTVKGRSGHRKTCKRGHLRTPENTYYSGNVKWCKPCRLDQQKAKRAHLKLLKSESA